MEHRAIIRTILLEKLSWMGIVFDKTIVQDDITSDTILSTPDSKVAIIVIPTNEEYMIAKETQKLINNE